MGWSVAKASGRNAALIAVALFHVGAPAWAGDGVPVDTITTLRSAPPQSGPYTDGGRQVRYGEGDNVQLISATVGGLTLTRTSVSKPEIAIRRVDNATVTGERLTFFYPGAITSTRIDIEGEEAMSMEQAINDDFITSGGLDVFLNVDGNVEKANNIERIDFVVADGLTLPTTPALLGEVGTIANEKQGNNDFQIALITAVDAFGEPSAFGPLRLIEGQVDYGDLGRPRNAGGTQLRNMYFRNGTAPAGGGGNGPVGYVRNDTNFIGMSYLSFAAMGATPGQRIYGYSLFPVDVTDSNDLVGLSDVPLTTSGGANGGDVYGGTLAIFSTPAAETEIGFGTAELSGEKSVQSAAASQFNVPGTDVIYSISVSNSGTASPDADSVFILDTLPDDLTFFNGDADGPGPGTQAVIFTDSGSGLAFDYATDVRYSNAATVPATFGDCGYAPAAGYDPAVAHVCIRPTGTMAASGAAGGAGTAAFEVSFRARLD